MAIVSENIGGASAQTAAAFSSGQEGRQSKIQDKALDSIIERQRQGNQLKNQMTLDESRDRMRSGVDLTDEEFDKKFSRGALRQIEREGEALESARQRGELSQEEYENARKQHTAKIAGLKKIETPRTFERGKEPGSIYKQDGLIGIYNDNGMIDNIRPDPTYVPPRTQKDNATLWKQSMDGAKDPETGRIDINMAKELFKLQTESQDMIHGKEELPEGVSDVQWGDPETDPRVEKFEQPSIIEKAGNAVKSFFETQSSIPAENIASISGVEKFINEYNVKGVEADMLVLARNRFEQEKNEAKKAVLYQELKDEIENIRKKSEGR